MSEPERDPESTTELAALFDKTAETPSDMERARLLAGAESVPGKRGRARWLEPRFVWPGALAAAAGALFLVLAPPRSPEPRPAKIAETASASSAEAATPEVATAAAEETATPSAESDDLALAVLGEDTDGMDLGPLMSEDEVNGAPGSGM